MISVINKIERIKRIIRSGRVFSNSQYLMETGWWNSYVLKMPVDKYNLPLPWVTYGFIDFIIDRLTKELLIFEFGSGNSTIFYAARVKKVVSVEHELNWYNQINQNVPSNTKLIFQELEYNGEYCRTAVNQKIEFSIIIVDGRDRINCLINSVNALADNGVIVLDDSERDDYQAGISYLLERKFRRLDFWGIAPGVSFKKCTTIFYKNNNCLLI